MGNVFLTDILKQPDSMRQAIRCYSEYSSKLEKVAQLKHSGILLTGMGSSHFCNIPATISLIDKGIPARVIGTSELLYYERCALKDDALLVIVSQSGESGEVVDLLKTLPEQLVTIGITNDIHSALGRQADIALEMCVAPELAVSTRTYLASLILTDLFASVMMDHPWENAINDWNRAINALEDFLVNHEGKRKRIMEFLGYPTTVSYIGRGPALATAECGALFTRETAKYPALAFDSGEFRHGPFEMVDGNFCSFIFAPKGATIELQKNLTEAIAAHGGKVVFVTDSDIQFEDKNVMILKHLEVGEKNATLVEIAAAQFFANEMALFLGHEPGVFRQSSKVTTAQ